MLAVSLKSQCAETTIPIEPGQIQGWPLFTLCEPFNALPLVILSHQQIQLIGFVYIEINITEMNYISTMKRFAIYTVAFVSISSMITWILFGKARDVCLNYSLYFLNECWQYIYKSPLSCQCALHLVTFNPSTALQLLHRLFITAFLLINKAINW